MTDVRWPKAMDGMRAGGTAQYTKLRTHLLWQGSPGSSVGRVRLMPPSVKIMKICHPWAVSVKVKPHDSLMTADMST